MMQDVRVYANTPPPSSSSSSAASDLSELLKSDSPSIIVRSGQTPTFLRKKRDMPWGIRFIQKMSDVFFPSLDVRRDFWYRVSIFAITYFSYTTFHLSRKPISIVKNVLNQNCSLLPTPSYVTNESSSTWCDWAPFDGPNAEVLLSTLDSAFLFTYAAGMFISGFIAERVNLRYFLSLGMLLSGLFTYLFGLAYTKGIHNLSYFILVQALAGFFQTSGWPGVVTVVGNWFGKGKRGLIFGLWNSHTSLGNILGSLIAGYYVKSDWGLSFIVPGAIIGGMGFFVFLFLVPKPVHVGCSLPDHHGDEDDLNQHFSSPDEPNVAHYSIQAKVERFLDTASFTEEDPSTLSVDIGTAEQEQTDDDFCLDEESQLICNHEKIDVKIKAVGFVEALKIPGVIEFSLCLFFAKLVSYTFLYWLPRYINTLGYDAKVSANLSTLFDVGGIVGGILAGVISDYSGMSATTCAGMLTVAIPMMFVYDSYGGEALWVNVTLLIVVGILVNGPYALITTAVSTELGTHPCLQGNARALATVTAIIDGTGSIGAALGPLLAGPAAAASKDSNWLYVFLMLMIADCLALVFLIRLMIHEIKRLLERRQANRLKVTIHPVSTDISRSNLRK